MKAGVNMKNKVMLVDDEPDILDLLEKSLILEGFNNITKIDNGLSAVETCKKIQPDIIVLDVKYANKFVSFLIVLYYSFPLKMMSLIKYLAWRLAEMIM